MSLRPPQGPTKLSRAETADLALNQEMLAEQASSLGHAGRIVESAMQRLRDFDAGATMPETRHDLVGKAAYAVWSLMVQRELMGLRRQDDVIRHYQIPRDVLNRVGECVTLKP